MKAISIGLVVVVVAGCSSMELFPEETPERKMVRQYADQCFMDNVKVDTLVCPRGMRDYCADVQAACTRWAKQLVKPTFNATGSTVR